MKEKRKDGKKASVAKGIALTIGIVSVAVPLIVNSPKLIEKLTKQPEFHIDVDSDKWGPQVIKNNQGKGADEHGENEPGGDGSANP